jgi:soluble lytic murein transglycosylase-like protein
MLEPILAQLQKTLYQSVLGDLQTLLAGRLSSVGASGETSLQAHPSAFDELIAAAAQRHGLDQALLKAVVQTESNFSPYAMSRTGAKGLMQLMDNTARQLGVVDSFDPAQNLDAGACFLRQLLDRYGGDETLALAAYNAGPSAVDRWGGIPPYRETLAYVPRVLGLREKYYEWTA